MKWTHGVRQAAIARLPKSWQPVASYHYYRVRSQLERELPLICRALRPGFCAVDVGANEGVYTHAFARTGARVEVFEPLPECLDVLRSYQRGHPGVSVHGDALGSAEGWATLHVPMRDGRPVSGRASLEAADPAEHGVALQVRVRTLDSFALPRVDVIKIDVEGREADVIRGALETIQAHRPVLLVEIEQRHLAVPMKHVLDLIAAMGDGYDGRFVHPERGIVRLGREEFDAATYQAPHNADKAGAFYINNFIFTPTGNAEKSAFLA